MQLSSKAQERRESQVPSRGIQQKIARARYVSLIYITMQAALREFMEVC